MAHNLNLRSGNNQTHNGYTLKELNDMRVAEAQKWVSDEMQDLAKDYCVAHAKLLAQYAGVGNLRYNHMFTDATIAKNLGFTKSIKAAQEIMLGSCNYYDEKYFMWPVERVKYMGANAMDCSPARWPEMIWALSYRVSVNPREPNVPDRFRIDRVIASWSFCQWSYAYDLVGVAGANVI